MTEYADQLFAELRQAQEKIQQLEDENAALKAELGLIRDRECEAKLCARFRLTPYEAIALKGLMSCNGRIMSHSLINQLLPDHMRHGRECMSENIASNLVCRLRKKIGVDVIQSRRSQGFAIHPDTRDWINEQIDGHTVSELKVLYSHKPNGKHDEQSPARHSTAPN